MFFFNDTKTRILGFILIGAYASLSSAYAGGSRTITIDNASNEAIGLTLFDSNGNAMPLVLTSGQCPAIQAEGFPPSSIPTKTTQIVIPSTCSGSISHGMGAPVSSYDYPYGTAVVIGVTARLPNPIPLFNGAIYLVPFKQSFYGAPIEIYLQNVQTGSITSATQLLQLITYYGQVPPGTTPPVAQLEIGFAYLVNTLNTLSAFVNSISNGGENLIKACGDISTLVTFLASPSIFGNNTNAWSQLFTNLTIWGTPISIPVLRYAVASASCFASLLAAIAGASSSGTAQLELGLQTLINDYNGPQNFIQSTGRSQAYIEALVSSVGLSPASYGL